MYFMQCTANPTLTADDEPLYYLCYSLARLSFLSIDYFLYVYIQKIQKYLVRFD